MPDVSEPGRPSTAESGPPPLVGARFSAAHKRPAERRADRRSDGKSDERAERFDTVLRGYDRAQVDRALIVRQEQVAALEREVQEGRRHWQAALDHIAALEAELRDRAPGVDESDRPAVEGTLAEKVVRMAKREAARIRVQATQEASDLVRAARVAAAEDRQATERAVGAWVSSTEREVAARLAEAQHELSSAQERLAALPPTKSDSATRSWPAIRATPNG